MDLLQLREVNVPGGTEPLFPQAAGFVHSQVTLEAPAAHSATHKYGTGSLLAESILSEQASTLDRVMSG